jgi:secreted Zn-dependent insulinase-like peptidase
MKHYYGANMRIVVVGAYTLDDLQDLVVKYYSDVPALPRDGSQPYSKSGSSSALSWTSTYDSPIEQYGRPFATSALKLHRIIPVKDRHNLSITWQLPPQLSLWKSKPCDFIAHLLGHEAQGSLLSALKKTGWVTTCVAGVGNDSLEVRVE